MIRLNRCFLLCVGCLFAMIVNGQNTYLSKKVTLPAGQVTLKTALKTISDQTGCVFSYDPVKIVDKQWVNIPAKGSQSLRASLSDILPKNVHYKLNGKYIVLQEIAGKNVLPAETTAIKPPSHYKSTSQNTKIEGKIGKSPSEERLVLPPLYREPEAIVPVQKVDSIEKQEIVLAEIHQEAVPIELIDSTKAIALKEDTVQKIKVPTVEPQAIGGIKQPVNLVDTTSRNVKPGFAGFMRKNGYLETGLSLNKQIGAISLHAGLYNVYAIVSIGSDYNRSYLLGIGAGTQVRIDKHFGLNFDLLRNSLIAGKTYLLQVRASNTQVIPTLNYTIGSSYKLFAGPTLNLIKSSYVSTVSTTDLGMLVGIGFTLGFKIDLKGLLQKQI
ncbi:MAG: hypothetical protein PHT07_09220 [Paludibacter sp.]|nr:hypothetical protein [Paludibacter sp.]